MKKIITLFCILIGIVSPLLGEEWTLAQNLAQMLIMNADGYGYSGEWAVHPAYFEYIEEIQPGGVLLHYSTTDLEKVKKTNFHVRGLLETTPFIAVDYVFARDDKGERHILGDGFRGGFVDYYYGVSMENLEEIAVSQSIILSDLGVNLVLGPTIDNSVECIMRREKGEIYIDALLNRGILPVIKHFPYLPISTNLHDASPDMKGTKYTSDIFTESADIGQITMTTHIYNSNVDDTLVTFSGKWMDLLKKEAGFNGLVMSDGLYMIQNFKNDGSGFYDPTVIETIPGVHDVAVYAKKAILAGHDLLILEGVANETLKIYKDLLSLAEEDSSQGEALRNRINESAVKIRTAKDRSFTDPVEFDPSILNDAFNTFFRR